MKEFIPGKESLQPCPKYFLGIVPDKITRYQFTFGREPTQSKLPFHITTIPPFYNLWGSEEKLIKVIRKSCSEIPIFFVGTSMKFGYFSKGQIVHYQFDGWTTQQMKDMHTYILNRLLPGIGINSEFIGKKYNPHTLIPAMRSRPKEPYLHKDLIWTAFLCNSLELWKKGGGIKDWTKVARCNLMSKYYFEGDCFSVIPVGIEKYKHYQWPKVYEIG